MRQEFFKDGTRYVALTGESPQKFKGYLFVAFTGASPSEIDETCVTKDQLNKMERVTEVPDDWAAAFEPHGFKKPVPASEPTPKPASKPARRRPAKRRPAETNLELDFRPNRQTQSVAAVLMMLTGLLFVVFSVWSCILEPLL